MKFLPILVGLLLVTQIGVAFAQESSQTWTAPAVECRIKISEPRIDSLSLVLLTSKDSLETLRVQIWKDDNEKRGMLLKDAALHPVEYTDKENAAWGWIGDKFYGWHTAQLYEMPIAAGYYWISITTESKSLINSRIWKDGSQETYSLQESNKIDYDCVFALNKDFTSSKPEPVKPVAPVMPTDPIKDVNFPVWLERDVYKEGETVVLYAKVAGEKGPHKDAEVFYTGSWQTLAVSERMEYDGATGYFKVKFSAPKPGGYTIKVVTTIEGKILSSFGKFVVLDNGLSYCGDGFCSAEENTISCNEFCKEINGNRVCEEVCSSWCPQDCSFVALGISTKEPLRQMCNNGCAYGTSCLPIGTRATDKEQNVYCSINNEFETQLADGESCQNSYECSSNFCSSGKCVNLEERLQRTESLLNQIVSFLSKLFGFGSK